MKYGDDSYEDEEYGDDDFDDFEEGTGGDFSQDMSIEDYLRKVFDRWMSMATARSVPKKR